MTEIVALSYCSQPVSFSFETMKEILSVSQQRNSAVKLSGALIYDNNIFLQWLEGDAQAIRSAFKRISGDPRHCKIQLLSVRKLEQRWFPDWSMTAVVTQDQKLRGFNLVPHLSVGQFNPYMWSEEDVAVFMDSVSDYLTRRPTPKSEPIDNSVAPQRVAVDPVSLLDRHLSKML